MTASPRITVNVLRVVGYNKKAFFSLGNVLFDQILASQVLTPKQKSGQLEIIRNDCPYDTGQLIIDESLCYFANLLPELYGLGPQATKQRSAWLCSYDFRIGDRLKITTPQHLIGNKPLINKITERYYMNMMAVQIAEIDRSDCAVQSVGPRLSKKAALNTAVSLNRQKLPDTVEIFDFSVFTNQLLV